MHPQPDLTKKELNSLSQAVVNRKYGGLHKWQQLYLYQRIALSWKGELGRKQVKEIGAYANRKNMGEDIVLPLKDNISKV